MSPHLTDHKYFPTCGDDVNWHDGAMLLQNGSNVALCKPPRARRTNETKNYFTLSDPTPWHVKLATLTSPSLCIGQVRVVIRFCVSLTSSCSLLPPIPPPHRLLYCDHLRPVFPAGTHVRLLSTSHTDCRKSPGILCDIFSDILFGILSGIYPNILSDQPCWHSFWHIFWRSFWHMLPDILSDILSDIFWHSCWHISWHSFWHIFWHSFC